MLLSKEENVKKPMDVNYVPNEEDVEISRSSCCHLDRLFSICGGLEEAETDREATFTYLGRSAENSWFTWL